MVSKFLKHSLYIEFLYKSDPCNFTTYFNFVFIFAIFTLDCLNQLIDIYTPSRRSIVPVHLFLITYYVSSTCSPSNASIVNAGLRRGRGGLVTSFLIVQVLLTSPVLHD